MQSTTSPEQVAEEICDDFPLFLYDGESGATMRKGVAFPDVFLKGVADRYIKEGTRLKIVETKDFHLSGFPEIDGSHLRAWTNTLERWLGKGAKIEYLMTTSLGLKEWTSKFFKSLQRINAGRFEVYDLKDKTLDRVTAGWVDTWQRYPCILADNPTSLWTARGYDGRSHTSLGLMSITPPESEEVGLIDVQRARFSYIVEKYGNRLKD